MLKINNLKVDLSSLGSNFILTGIRPYYKYDNGKRTNEILGQSYEVAIVEQSFEKMNVKIPNLVPLVNFDSNNLLKVRFTNLQVGLYQDFFSKQIRLKAVADSLEVVQYD